MAASIRISGWIVTLARCPVKEARTDPNLRETASKTASSGFKYVLAAGTLQPGTTNYWKVVGKTMALQTKTSPVWSFTTAGSAPPPPPPAAGESCCMPRMQQ
jgi:hypothetical protein